MNQPTYAIHPAIGIARLGNSPAEFYLAPEATGALPTDCDTGGNPARDASGAEQPVGSFKDEQLRIKRQAARFRIFVYDDANPQGRELKIGDPIQGLESAGTLADIEDGLPGQQKGDLVRVPAARRRVWLRCRAPAPQRRHHPGGPAPPADHRPRPADRELH